MSRRVSSARARGRTRACRATPRRSARSWRRRSVEQRRRSRCASPPSGSARSRSAASVGDLAHGVIASVPSSGQRGRGRGGASRARTSSSVVCAKSAYQSADGVERRGVVAQTTSSTSLRNSAQVVGGRDRHRDHDAARAAAAAAPRSRRACVEPVASPSSTRMTVRPASVERRPVAAIEPLAPLQLAPSRAATASMAACGMRRSGDVGIEHAHAAAGDRAHRQLLVAGHAELAHHEDVERCAQRAARPRRRPARRRAAAPSTITLAIVGDSAKASCQRLSGLAAVSGIACGMPRGELREPCTRQASHRSSVPGSSNRWVAPGTIASCFSQRSRA